MAIRITEDAMILEIDNRVVATARFSEHAAADANGTWIVSTHPARLFTHDVAIRRLTDLKAYLRGCCDLLEAAATQGSTRSSSNPSFINVAADWYG
jgi:hypothetical protein